MAISPHPERWEEDGVYSDDGISLVQALEMLPGIEEMDLEKRGAVVAASTAAYAGPNWKSGKGERDGG